jgi:hypothetical protein
MVVEKKAIKKQTNGKDIHIGKRRDRRSRNSLTEETLASQKKKPDAKKSVAKRPKDSEIEEVKRRAPAKKSRR